jgi:fatty-acyl-CoA synthase
MNQLFARKDDSASQAWLRALELTARIEIEKTRTFPVVVDELGARFGDAPALITRRETLSHSWLAARANRIARWACAQGIRKGDTVCLLMPNCPDYLAIWLGITRIGGIVALLNTHLKGEALAHGIQIASPRLVIAAEHLADRISSRARIWRYGPDFCRLLECFSDAPLAVSEQRDVTLNDRALLIYTSGTTGQPKAAQVSHRRIMNWTHWFAGMMDTSAQDRLFNCMPMYHGIGGIVALGAALVGGGSVICREKFSAVTFWDDVAESRATIFQYTGELCRHLLAGGATMPEHNLRLAVGNGLSGDVWQAFQDRFAIPRILEFHASTEGNFSLCNVEGKAGSIGRVPDFLAHRFPVALVKLDFAAGRPARGDDGLCIAAARGETGEALGRIGEGLAHFEGYADAGATDEKVLRDVFMPGDAWLRSGDLMRQDAQGFFYFVDRIDDTFQWKGENVATTKVAAAAAGAPGVKIFGIPGEIRSLRL